MSLPDRFLPQSVSVLPKMDAVERILRAAVAAADPDLAVRSHVQLQGERLLVGDTRYDLSGFRRVLVVGIGKASLGMAGAVLALLGERVSGGLVVTKHAGGSNLGPLTVVEGSHPVPDERSVAAAQQMAGLLSAATPQDLIICVLSGGGSALLNLPMPPTTLADQQALTRLLLQSGADIREMNALRRHIDQVKGGGLLRFGKFRRWVSLILSDVIGGSLENIASGPTAPDPSTYADALAVLKKYRLVERAPQAIRNELERGAAGEIPETLKPGDPLFERVQNLIIGSNQTSAQASLRQAQAEGFHSELIEPPFLGEAAQTGREMVTLLKDRLAKTERPTCIIGGGETIVVVRGKGVGGRNQEVALGAVSELDGLERIALISLATDGEDATTDAAGAIVDGGTFRRATALGMDPRDYLARNDSYSFFQPLGQLLQPGPTGTNVNDLYFLFAF